MRSSTIGFGAMLAMILSATPSIAQEVIYVEPANRPVLLNMAHVFFQAPIVQRPETICGNPGGSPAIRVGCYEFLMTYVTYTASGDTIIHLPQCNGVTPLDPQCEANNLCAAPTGLQLAPICGNVEAKIWPLTSADALTLGDRPTASWDGTSVSALGQAWINTRTGGLSQSRTFRIPVIRMPQTLVRNGGGAFFGLLEGVHTNLEGTEEHWGFFSVMHRILTADPLLGDISNLDATPQLF